MSDRVRGVALGAVALVGAVVLAIFLSGGQPLPPLPSPAAPVLPDLAVEPMTDFLATTDEEGNQLLRFTAAIINVGPGPLIVRADRQAPSDPQWRVVQWFDEPDGTKTARETGGTLVYGGHGHDHWHLKFGASYHLLDSAGGEQRSETKAGFCFFDQVLARPELVGTQTTRAFPPDGCGGQSSTHVSMGITPGWSDPYYWELEDQSVDITGLPDGPYRVTAVADPDGWLEETNETNNDTWTEIQLGSGANGLRTVQVVASAPAPAP